MIRVQIKSIVKLSLLNQLLHDEVRPSRLRLLDITVRVIQGCCYCANPIPHLVVEILLLRFSFAEPLELTQALLDRAVWPGEHLPEGIFGVDIHSDLGILFRAWVLVFVGWIRWLLVFFNGFLKHDLTRNEAGGNNL